MSSTLRQTVTALGVAGVAGASLLGMTGTAAAATTTASSCTHTVSGHSGDALHMDADAVKSQLISAVSDAKPLIVLGESDRDKVRQAYAAGKIKPLSLGTVKSSTYSVSGRSVAAAAIDRLEHTDGLQSVADKSANRDRIRSKIGSACGLTVRVASTAAHHSSTSGSTHATSQHHSGALEHLKSATSSAAKRWPSESTPSTTTSTDKKKSPAKASAPKVDTGKLQATPGRRAKRDYSGIPVAKPGTAPDGSTFDPNRFGAAPDQAKSPYLSDRVNRAGDASALPPGKGGPIPVPLLVAVVALAGASAGLVRTWMLRRVAAQ